MSDNSVFDVQKESGRLVIRFSSTLENIDSVAGEVKVLMADAGLLEYSFGVRIVMREGLTNAVRHGNKNDPLKLVKFEISIQGDTLTMIIEDQGDGFDWAMVKADCSPDKEVDIPLDHGRGFPIIEEYFDGYRYNRKGNILTLKKDISS